MKSAADNNPRKKAAPAPTVALDESVQLNTAVACTAAVIANPTELGSLRLPGESCADATARLGIQFAAALLLQLYPGKNPTLLVANQ